MPFNRPSTQHLAAEAIGKLAVAGFGNIGGDGTPTRVQCPRRPPMLMAQQGASYVWVILDPV